MSAQHTTGPWDIQDRTIFALDVHGRVNRFSAHVQGGYENGGESFAFGDAKICTSDAELEANARLIAAAPELLELAYQYQSDLRHPPTSDSVERRLERIAAVLAKVGGA